MAFHLLVANLLDEPRVLATVGESKVVVSKGTVAVSVRGRRVWLAMASGREQVVKVGGKGLFIVLRPSIGFDLFDGQGHRLRSRGFSADRDPRPFLVDDRYVVWGEGTYNRINPADKAELRWHFENRRFFLLDTTTLQSRPLGTLAEVGLSVGLQSHRLTSVTVSNSFVMGTSAKPMFWKLTQVLPSTKIVSRKRLRLSESKGLLNLMLETEGLPSNLEKGLRSD